MTFPYVKKASGVFSNSLVFPIPVHKTFIATNRDTSSLVVSIRLINSIGLPHRQSSSWKRHGSLPVVAHNFPCLKLRVGIHFQNGPT